MTTLCQILRKNKHCLLPLKNINWLVYVRGEQIIKICKSNLKILDARMVTWKTPYTKDQQFSEATV